MNFEPGQLKVSIEIRWGAAPDDAITTEIVEPDGHHMLREGNVGDLPSEIKRDLCAILRDGVDKAIARSGGLKVPGVKPALEGADA